jgi:hypothetical protein
MTGKKQSAQRGDPIRQGPLESSPEYQGRKGPASGTTSAPRKRSKSRATKSRKEHEHELCPASVFLDGEEGAYLHLVCEECGKDFVITGSLARCT